MLFFYCTLSTKKREHLVTYIIVKVGNSEDRDWTDKILPNLALCFRNIWYPQHNNNYLNIPYNIFVSINARHWKKPYFLFITIQYPRAPRRF